MLQSLAEKQDHKSSTATIKTLRKMLEILLTLNVLEFDKKYYLQTFGRSMGVALGPSYANIFMSNLEETMPSTAF